MIMNKSYVVYCLILVLTSVACQKTIRTDKVKIGYNPISYDLPFFVAQEKGYFREQGLDVDPVLFATSNLMAEALIAGRIDVITSVSVAVLLGVEQNDPGKFKVFMIHVSSSSRPADYILVKKNASIKSIEDLRGRKIGVHPGSTMLTYAKLALKQFLDPNHDIDIVQLPNQLQIQALVTGQVDALFAYEPVASISLSEGLADVLLAAPKNLIMDPMPSGAYAFSSKLYEDNPEITKKIQTAMEKAVDYIREHEREAKKFIAKFTPIEEEIALKINVVEYWKREEINKTSVQLFSDILYREGILFKKVNTLTFLF